MGSEVRKLTIKNHSEENINLEVTSLFEPVLSKLEDDISHPAFNNLFLKYQTSKQGDIVIKRNRRGEQAQWYLGASLNSENGEDSKLEFEIDRARVLDMIQNSKPFTNKVGLVTDPCVAFKKKLEIKAGEEKTVYLVICVSQEEEKVLHTLDYYKIPENMAKEFQIARAKVEEEAKYLNLNKSDLLTFYQVLPYILHQNPLKSLYMEELKGKRYQQSDFWKYGISGDFPIILVTVKSPNDIYVVKEILKVHETLRIKGIKTDLCILDYEKNVYEQYVKDQIIQEILNLQIGYLQNISGGIFLLNANEIEDEELFCFRANLWIDAQKGGTVREIIKEMEDEYQNRIPKIGEEKKKRSENITFEKIEPMFEIKDFKFYNGFGGFSKDRKGIHDKRK